MSLSEGIIIALFVMTIVFIVLIALSLFLKIQSYIINRFNQGKTCTNTFKKEGNENISISSKELDASNIDGKTIAIIMVAISKASHIPVNLVKLKSIKEIH